MYIALHGNQALNDQPVPTKVREQEQVNPKKMRGGKTFAELNSK